MSRDWKKRLKRARRKRRVKRLVERQRTAKSQAAAARKQEVPAGGRP